MLEYLDKTLTKGQRKKVARCMTQYNNMDAIIKSKKSELHPSKTSTIKQDAVQESNNSPSESDVYLEKKLVVDDMVSIKRKLDIVYNKIKPLHKMIWDEHFINGVRDFEIYYNDKNHLSKKSYYREKNELMLVVSESLGIGTK